MTYIPEKYQSDKHVWLNRLEAAECLGMGYEQFRRNWKKGKFSTLDRHPLTKKISRESVDRFLKEGVSRFRKNTSIERAA